MERETSTWGNMILLLLLLDSWSQDQLCSSTGPTTTTLRFLGWILKFFLLSPMMMRTRVLEWDSVVLPCISGYLTVCVYFVWWGTRWLALSPLFLYLRWATIAADDSAPLSQRRPDRTVMLKLSKLAPPPPHPPPSSADSVLGWWGPTRAVCSRPPPPPSSPPSGWLWWPLPAWSAILTRPDGSIPRLRGRDRDRAKETERAAKHTTKARADKNGQKVD